MNKSILYVSKYCPHSMKFLSKFKEVPISNSFEIVFVESVLDNLDSDVDCVPYVYIPVLNEPLKGSDAFKWLNQITKGISINNEQMNKTETKINSEQKKNGINDFDSTMSSGFSDDFSFISTDNPQKHSFEFLNDDLMKGESTRLDDSIPKDDLTKRMEQMRRERDEVFKI